LGIIYSFDIDGTICTDTNGDYEKAVPYKDRIDRINKLYYEGHTIILFTGRGNTTGIDWGMVTKQQLKEWRVAYHQLIFGKPYAEIYIDNKGVNADVFFRR